MPIKDRWTERVSRCDTLRIHHRCSILAKSTQPEPSTQEKTLDKCKMNNVLLQNKRCYTLQKCQCHRRQRKAMEMFQLKVS